MGTDILYSVSTLFPAGPYLVCQVREREREIERERVNSFHKTTHCFGIIITLICVPSSTNGIVAVELQANLIS